MFVYSGKWFYKTDSDKDENKKQFVSFVNKKLVMQSKVSFCFVPNPNYAGVSEMTVGPALINKKTGEIIVGKREFKVQITVTAVNDRPQLNKGLVEAPVLPYNKTEDTGNGSTISQLVSQSIAKGRNKKLASDPDGNIPGK